MSMYVVYGESSVCGHTAVGAVLRLGQWEPGTMNTIDVFEIDITLPGHSEVSLAATTPCRLQLCAVLAQLNTC